MAAGMLISTSVVAQSGGHQEEDQPPAGFVASSIPGVVAAGTRIELVATGLQRTEGPVAMQDGSMLVSGANRILRVDLSGNVSTFLENSNETNAMGWDPDGRLVSVQRARGNERVGVLYPRDGVATLADSYQGEPFNSLNDMAVDSDGRVYAATNAGVEVFSQHGALLGVMPVQWRGENGHIRKPQNVAFGGPDRRTLYIVGEGTIFRVRTLSQGPQRSTK